MKPKEPCRRIRTSYRARAAVLSLSLLLGHSDAVFAVGETMADLMAEAMARMMQAMGSMSNTNNGGGQGWSMPSMGQGFPGMGMMPFGTMMPGMADWQMPFQGPTQMFSMYDKMDQFGTMLPDKHRQMRNLWGTGPSKSPFEGIWEGVNGELVIVQGERFRIYAPGATFVDGTVKIQGDRIALYNPVDQQARPFDYAMQEGRLVLRDDAGQLFLYRRLVLDAERSAESSYGER